MPQIWMTYEELANLLGCTVAEVRYRIHLERLDRKLSRDGNKRVKLSPSMIVIFIEWLKTVDFSTNIAVDELRHVHHQLRSSDEPEQPGLSRHTYAAKTLR
jgi:hypothetical protein